MSPKNKRGAAVRPICRARVLSWLRRCAKSLKRWPWPETWQVIKPVLSLVALLRRDDLRELALMMRDLISGEP